MGNRPYRAVALASLFLLVAQVVQAAQPEWNEQNPCPECAQEKQFADYFADRLARLDLEAQVTREALDANTRKLLQTQHRIDDIDTRLDNERGEGGESYDPHTGITVRSYTESGGKVRMDTIGPDDRLMDSYSYPRLSTRELREERITRAAEVRATKAEGARLRSQRDAATGMRDKAIADLEQARRALQDCIAARCR